MDMYTLDIISTNYSDNPSTYLLFLRSGTHDPPSAKWLAADELDGKEEEEVEVSGRGLLGIEEDEDV